ncbi:MAG: hypothetical protein RQ826_14935 [Xanthomonadales bacterium]|nr:hypothetical protein [Xanthomonadales bacterium]
MKTRNYRLWREQGMPRAMHDAWQWVCAVDAYDFDHRQPLADLVKSEPVPEELRPIIAEIVAGNRPPNKKRAAKLKIPADERMKIAGSISAVLGLVDAVKYDIVDERYLGKGVTMIGHRDGRDPGRPRFEPNDPVISELETEARKIIAGSAEQLGVSIETIENLLRDLRGKMERYPNI